MVLQTNKDKGRACLTNAIAYFGSNGYTVSIPLNDTQNYDLVVEKDGVFQSIQCKFGGRKVRNNDDAYECGLRSVGAKGTYHGNVKDSGVDLLFCLRPDEVMYLIPVKDIDNVSSLRLITSKSKFSCGLDTSKYIVTN